MKQYLLDAFNTIVIDIKIIMSIIWNVKDAIMGSAVYSFYAHFFLNKSFIKNLISFFIGIVFSAYLSNPIYMHYHKLPLEVVSFLTGLLGMKVVEVLYDTNWKEILANKLNKKS